MASKRVAVVTGGNKGIGFAIVRGLCKQFDGDVFLTARDKTRGAEAVKELNKEGLHPKFQQLDIDDQSSIDRLKVFLQQNYGGLDVLVNNAGIAYKDNSTAPFSEQAEVTVRTNYWGTVNVCNILFSILRPHARVVNVSSQVSIMALERCGEDLRAKLTSLTSMDDLNRYMKEFVSSVKSGTFKSQGWPEWSYGVSKIGVTAMTPLQQAELDKDTSRPDIVVNACCPGYVNTDMSGHKGPLSTDQGADTPIYLAMLPPGVTSPRGEFVAERKVLAWRKGEGSF